MFRKLLIAGAFLLSTLGFATSSVANPHLTVGFVYVGPIGDHGWTYMHDKGRLAIEEEFGDMVKTVYVENVKYGPDAERVIRQMAQEGVDIIFATSFGYMEQMLKVAKEFPDVYFEHATGYKTAPNMSAYSSRFYEGRYIQGVIAGTMSKAGKAGYIASFPIPEVIRGINSFYLGATSVNPDFDIDIVWVNTWYDPGKEADAAKVLISEGADIITQHTDSPAPLQTAEKMGVVGFGQASDQIKFAPKAQLTAILDVWDSYYISRVRAAMDGTWTESNTWGGMDTGMVQMADYTNMPLALVQQMQMLEADILNGKFKPFGDLDDAALGGMMEYVDGIDATVPK
tara:strand:+ start:778 stop:1803 length:1026 start_codon:yes stop_codon:yes gene_type:complete